MTIVYPEKFRSPASSPPPGDADREAGAASPAPAGTSSVPVAEEPAPDSDPGPLLASSFFPDWTCPRCRSTHPPRVLVCRCSGRDPDEVDAEARRAIEGIDAADPPSPLLHT